jgi:hypothetical protein
MASMRTCGCYGSTWPYSLRVCDMCIKDDAASLTGRVRHCGICGVVACDEDCGVELVECTDVESWNNAGEFFEGVYLVYVWTSAFVLSRIRLNDIDADSVLFE